MGLFDPFGGGGSTANQTTTTVSGQGQFNKGSTVFQGGSKGARGQNARFLESGATDLSGNSGQIGGYSVSGKGAKLTVNSSGISPDALSALLGSITTPAPVVVNQPSPQPISPAAPMPDASTASSTDTSSAAGSFSGWLAGLGATGVIVIGVILFVLFRKNR